MNSVVLVFLSHVNQLYKYYILLVLFLVVTDPLSMLFSVLMDTIVAMAMANPLNWRQQLGEAIILVVAKYIIYIQLCARYS